MPSTCDKTYHHQPHTEGHTCGMCSVYSCLASGHIWQWGGRQRVLTLAFPTAPPATSQLISPDCTAGVGTCGTGLAKGPVQSAIPVPTGLPVCREMTVFAGGHGPSLVPLLSVLRSHTTQPDSNIAQTAKSLQLEGERGKKPQPINQPKQNKKISNIH